MCELVLKTPLKGLFFFFPDLELLSIHLYSNLKLFESPEEMVNIFGILICSSPAGNGPELQWWFSFLECPTTTHKSLEQYSFKNLTITQKIQRQNISLKIYRWLTLGLSLTTHRKIARHHASLATSCMRHSTRYPPSKAPRNRLVFLKLLPVVP